MTLDHLAYLSHENEILRRRYSSFADLEDDIIAEFQKKTIDIREKTKRNIRTVQYLIESNLFVERKSKEKYLEKLDYDYLLAFADWLVVLQDNSDMVHHGFDWVGFEVTSEYNINTIMTDKAEKIIDEVKRRRYDSPDYSIKGDEIDEQYIVKAAEAFEKDMGFSLSLFFDVLRYLRWNYSEESSFTNLAGNVVAINKNRLIDDISNVFDDTSKDIIVKVLDYLTIDAEGLKTCDGKTHEILPIWEREKRNNRFDQKPLILVGEDYIYSPVIMHVLFQTWWNGIPDFYPPYEIGLDNTLAVLEEWKERYEELMVYDLCEIFTGLGLKNVFPNMKLHRIDKGGNHPAYLGDYDLVVIDDSKGIIWNIESNVLKKVGSVFEDSMQQKGFFEKHEFDKKFQRRIDYLIHNYKTILNSIGIDYQKEYDVRSYMVTNKIFISRVKQVQFPILSFNEMKRLVESFYCNK